MNKKNIYVKKTTATDETSVIKFKKLSSGCAIVPACQLFFYIISYQYVIIRTRGKRVSGGKERPGEKSHGGKECLGKRASEGP